MSGFEPLAAGVAWARVASGSRNREAAVAGSDHGPDHYARLDAVARIIQVLAAGRRLRGRRVEEADTSTTRL